jgi:hypothetical protein
MRTEGFLHGTQAVNHFNELGACPRQCGVRACLVVFWEISDVVLFFTACGLAFVSADALLLCANEGLLAAGCGGAGFLLLYFLL